MTETTEARAAERHEERCFWGSKSDNPCWREASTWLEPDEQDFPVCAEHARLRRCVDDEEELHRALDTVTEWINALDHFDHLEAVGTAAMRARDELLVKYLDAATKKRAVMLVVNQEPSPEAVAPLALEQAEEIARLITRVDALNNARTVIEDAPEELIGVRSRWEMAAALEAAHAAAHEEVERCQERLGLRPAG